MTTFQPEPCETCDSGAWCREHDADPSPWSNTWLALDERRGALSHN